MHAFGRRAITEEVWAGVILPGSRRGSDPLLQRGVEYRQGGGRFSTGVAGCEDAMAGCRAFSRAFVRTLSVCLGVKVKIELSIHEADRGMRIAQMSP